MATPLPIIAKPGSNALVPVAITWTAGDNVNGNTFPCTGRETLHALNTAGTTQTVTVISTADSQGRTRNIGPITLAVTATPGSEVVFQRFNQLGFASGTLITVNVSASTVQLYVSQDPL